MPHRPFKALFCERFHCPEASYEEIALHKCLRPHARLLSPLARKMQSDYFALDLKFIRNLGTVTGVREAYREVQDFGDAVRARRSFLRTVLNVRASGGKALDLAQRVFRAH